MFVQSIHLVFFIITHSSLLSSWELVLFVCFMVIDGILISTWWPLAFFQASAYWARCHGRSPQTRQQQHGGHECGTDGSEGQPADGWGADSNSCSFSVPLFLLFLSDCRFLYLMSSLWQLSVIFHSILMFKWRMNAKSGWKLFRLD